MLPPLLGGWTGTSASPGGGHRTGSGVCPTARACRGPGGGKGVAHRDPRTSLPGPPGSHRGIPPASGSVLPWAEGGPQSQGCGGQGSTTILCPPISLSRPWLPPRALSCSHPPVGVPSAAAHGQVGPVLTPCPRPLPGLRPHRVREVHGLPPGWRQAREDPPLGHGRWDRRGGGRQSCPPPAPACGFGGCPTPVGHTLERCPHGRWGGGGGLTHGRPDAGPQGCHSQQCCLSVPRAPGCPQGRGGPSPVGNWYVMVCFSARQDRKTMTGFARCPTRTPTLSSSALTSPTPTATKTS